MHSLSIGPVGLDIDYVLVWATLLLALLWLRVLVSTKALRQQIETTFFAMFFAAILGARIAFVWRMWPQYEADWLAVADIRDGGFVPGAGAIWAFIVLVFRIYLKPLTRRATFKTVLLTTCCIFPVYVWVTLANRAETMPYPVVSTVSNQSFDLADLTDKPIVLNVWATWCPPCRREMPVLAKAQQRYPNIHFVFLNQGESAAQVNAFLQSEQLTLSNVFLDPTGNISEQFGVAVLPTTLFYAKDGRLLYQHVGGLSDASLEYALQKAATLTAP